MFSRPRARPGEQYSGLLQIPASPERRNHVGPLDGSTHVLEFLAKERALHEHLLIIVTTDISEPVPVDVDLVVDVAGREPRFVFLKPIDVYDAASNAR